MVSGDNHKSSSSLRILASDVSITVQKGEGGQLIYCLPRINNYTNNFDFVLNIFELMYLDFTARYISSLNTQSFILRKKTEQNRVNVSLQGKESWS